MIPQMFLVLLLTAGALFSSPNSAANTYGEFNLLSSYGDPDLLSSYGDPDLLSCFYEADEIEVVYTSIPPAQNYAPPVVAHSQPVYNQPPMTYSQPLICGADGLCYPATGQAVYDSPQIVQRLRQVIRQPAVHYTQQRAGGGARLEAPYGQAFIGDLRACDVGVGFYTARGAGWPYGASTTACGGGLAGYDGTTGVRSRGVLRSRVLFRPRGGIIQRVGGRLSQRLRGC